MLEDAAAVVDRLWADIGAGDHFPTWLAELDLELEDALAIQAGLLARRRAAGETLAGFKVGLTSERARRQLGADERPFGYILGSGVVPSGAELPATSMRHGAIEAELVLTLGSRLAGPVGVAEARAAVSRISAGFELNERRPGSARAGLVLLATDRMAQFGIVEGSGVDPSEVADSDGIQVTMRRNGEIVYSGVSRDEVDDHFESLARLSEVLGRHGLALEPGHKVITGAFCRFDAVPGDTWSARFEPVGDVEVSFA